jgi:hypothetical protein
VLLEQREDGQWHRAAAGSMAPTSTSSVVLGAVMVVVIVHVASSASS